MSGAFEDLFVQLFYSTEAWGYLGVLIVIILSLTFASKIKYSWLFLCFGQILMTIGYINESTTYQWHIIFLVVGAIFTAIVGLREQ